MRALVRVLVSACVVFGGVFAMMVIGTRVHRGWVAAHDAAAPPPGISLAVDSETPAAHAAGVAALRGFLGVAPARRLDAALAASDTRFLGLQAEALSVPGAADADHGFRPARIHAIPGVGPAPASLEHAALIERARRYALAYNALLLRRTSRAPPSSSATARSPERTAPSGVGATR